MSLSKKTTSLLFAAAIAGLVAQSVNADTNKVLNVNEQAINVQEVLDVLAVPNKPVLSIANTDIQTKMYKDQFSEKVKNSKNDSTLVFNSQNDSSRMSASIYDKNSNVNISVEANKEQNYGALVVNDKLSNIEYVSDISYEEALNLITSAFKNGIEKTASADVNLNADNVKTHTKGSKGFVHFLKWGYAGFFIDASTDSSPSP